MTVPYAPDWTIGVGRVPRSKVYAALDCAFYAAIEA
jgi:hypothetical protein